MNSQDQELVKRILDGEESGFKDLVAAYQDTVYNVSLGFLKRVEDAEDMAQEIFIHIYEKLDSYKGEAKLSTWIYRIAVNKCLEKIRMNSRKKRWTKLVSIFDSSGTEAKSSDDFYHPGVSLENKERAIILRSKIEELPENQRVAFTLHKFEHMPYSEIADVMNRSLSSIESLMHRAKTNLRVKLKDYYESDRKF